jgi:hypothetical protein
MSYRGKKIFYLDKPLETRTVLQTEDSTVIASIDYKIFDLSRKKKIEIYSNYVPLSLMVCMDYLSTLQNGRCDETKA